MNPFATSDEQRLLADNLHRLLRDSNEFSKRRERLAKDAPDRLALWPALADQGVIAAAFDEARGGFAGDARTIAVMMAEIGPALAVEPYLAAAVVAGRVLQSWASPSAAAEAIDELIGGRQVWVLAHHVFGDPFAGPRVSAVRTGDACELSGTIPAVRHAELAHRYLIPARNADSSIDLYCLERGHPGLGIEGCRLIDAAGAATVQLRDVRVPLSARMQFDVPARDILHEALEWGILGLAAETAGIICALNEITFAYLMTRKQFGQPLGGFQALQHRAADMWVAAEELLAIVDLGIDCGAPRFSRERARNASAMKVIANKAGRRVGNESVQMHGGMGVSDELIVSHYFRRLAAIRGDLGTDDVHQFRFRSLL